MKGSFEFYAGVIAYSLGIGSAFAWPGQTTFAVLFLILAIISSVISVSVLADAKTAVERVVEELNKPNAPIPDALDKVPSRIVLFYAPLVVLAAVGSHVFTAILWAFTLFVMLALEMEAKKEYEKGK